MDIIEYHNLEGIAKLGQRFLVELLTKKESFLYLPDRGCSFLARLSNINTEYDVRVAFLASKSNLKKNLRKSIKKHITLRSEVYKDSEIILVTLEDNTLVLTIAVTNLSNDTIHVTTQKLTLR